MQGTLPSFQRRFPIVSIKFHAGDIHTQSSHWVAKSSKISPQLRTPIYWVVEDPKICYNNLLPWFTPYHVATFGWVLSAELCVRSSAVKKNAEFLEGGKNEGLILAVIGPTFMKFWGDLGDPSQFPRLFPIVSIMFLAGYIGPQIWHWVAKSSKIDTFWAPNFVGGHYAENLFVVFNRRSTHAKF